MRLYDLCSRIRCSWKAVDCFSQANLTAPILFCEVPVGDGERSPIVTWLPKPYPALLPQAIQRLEHRRTTSGWATAFSKATD